MARPKGSKDTKLRRTVGRKMQGVVEARGGAIPAAKAALVKATIDAGEITPLQYLMRVMRDDTATVERRDWAAKTAAPYYHPQLARVEHKGPGDDGVFEFRIKNVD